MASSHRGGRGAQDPSVCYIGQEGPWAVCYIGQGGPVGWWAGGLSQYCIQYSACGPVGWYSACGPMGWWASTVQCLWACGLVQGLAQPWASHGPVQGLWAYGLGAPGPGSQGPGTPDLTQFLKEIA